MRRGGTGWSTPSHCFPSDGFPPPTMSQLVLWCLAAPSLLALTKDLSARRTLLQIRKLRPEGWGRKGFVLDLLPGHVSQNWAPPQFPGLSPGPAGRDLRASIQAFWELFVEGLQERACLSSASISVIGERRWREGGMSKLFLMPWLLISLNRT